MSGTRTKASTSVAPAAAAARPSQFAQLDQQVHATLARLSSSLSIASGLLAGSDWAMHLAVSPGKQLELLQLAWMQAAQLTQYGMASAAAGGSIGTDATGMTVAAPIVDRRFSAPEWQQWPFNLLHQSFLQTEQWWAAATQGVWGVEKHHEQEVAFAARQLLDMYSPGNQLLSNPEVLRQTIAEHGQNLVRGAQQALQDIQQQLSQAPRSAPEGFAVGRELTVTPGQVVLKNQLMELLQYAPASAAAKVYPEPILIVPAWIMKYYILDLSATDSLINYLVQQGHTVFCISWKNPGPAERDLGMDDYLQSGFHAALEAVCAIVPKRRVHGVGYCLGGTLLAIAAAAMARDGDHRLATLTMLAAQTDFNEPGELGLFIDESQVSLLEAQMAEAGVLKAEQMAGAFQMLRSYDLLWSQLVKKYLQGETGSMNHLMAWNADATRMPARMHSQYLRRLFLNDDLSEGRYPVNGKPVALSDIVLPTFMVGTLTDHVAPWRSVYKLHYLSPAEITFVLTSGGHNAGIVSPPGKLHRQYQLMQRKAGAVYMPSEQWQAKAPQHEGSWWPAWQAWLAAHSGAKVKPPSLGNHTYAPLAPAPGSYVMEK